MEETPDTTPEKTVKGSKALAILCVGQFLAGLLAVGLGFIYDLDGREPGMLVIAGLASLGGPAFWGAFKLANGGSK